ncbi:MAG: hypothetical protein F6K25_13165 [Okeania sp. SIO2G4]|uniref:hypothetical protein n=1 Tax=unclassified Okeania TaxID=2634635 RepID=UPI0013B9F1F0|nr:MULTISPECIES: hypothetical protein [unclassified Okeania]NEP04222.1 hypothetical protein [Okeania sp. SIO4D6]NEP72882.1 hypothetical protein [Okeania sp. SIO2G5]NEP93669.1 hypothetical protein [Okeania sp. SIO2F5]NEQ91599.1 hypothetical protein [Okeania sp. SIO2G4]
MEPIELTAVAIAYHFLTKYVEKTGEGLAEKTTENLGKLWQGIKTMPANTFAALKPARENPFPGDFEQAIREMEAVANQNPELKQDIIDVVAVAKEEYPEYVKNLEAKLEEIKSQGITAEKINALFQGSTITGGVVGNTGNFIGNTGTTIEGNVNFNQI